MDLIVDANVLFAALIKKGITQELLLRNDFHLYAPEFVLEEFYKYYDLVVAKTEMTRAEFYGVIGVFLRNVALIPASELKPFLRKATLVSPDVKDVPYVALALKLGAPIWSNDRALKQGQKEVKVYNTSELVGA
ncbi:hypothetical protein HY546_02665 [archaeon]|nr:hypothetical protein [archaeon]